MKSRQIHRLRYRPCFLISAIPIPQVRSQLVLQWRRFQARRGSGERAGPRRRTLSTEVPASGTVQRRQMPADAERAASDAEQLTVTSLLGGGTEGGNKGTGSEDTAT